MALSLSIDVGALELLSVFRIAFLKWEINNIPVCNIGLVWLSWSWQHSVAALDFLIPSPPWAWPCGEAQMRSLARCPAGDTQRVDTVGQVGSGEALALSAFPTELCRSPGSAEDAEWAELFPWPLLSVLPHLQEAVSLCCLWGALRSLSGFPQSCTCVCQLMIIFLKKEKIPLN